MKLPGEGSGGNRKRLLIAIVAAAVAAGYYFLSRELGSLDLQGLLEDVSNTLGAWTYLLVGAFAFAETGAFVGLVVPGETVMLLGGAVAGQGAIDIYLLIAIAWFSAWAGDTTSFFIGRRLGREFVLRNGPRFGIGHERFEKVEDYFSPPWRQDDLHRPLHQPRARLRALHRRQLGHALPRLRPLQHPRHRALGQRPHPRRLLLLAQHRERRQVRRQGRLRAWRRDRRRRRDRRPLPPLPGRGEPPRRGRAGWSATRRPAGSSRSARRFRPQLAFLWERVTPGGTFGLEFTSLMAIFAVASFVLVSYTVLVSGEPGPTPGDTTAIEIAERLRAGWLTDLAKAFTHLGSTAVVGSLALRLRRRSSSPRRRWAEFWVLVAGAALIFVGVHEIKDVVDRPRPAGGSDRRLRLLLPQRPRRLLDLLRLAGGDDRDAAAAGDGARRRGRRGRHRADRAGRPLPRLPRRPLPQRRQRRLGAGAAAFSFCAAVALVITTVRQNGHRAAAGAAEDRAMSTCCSASPGWSAWPPSSA